jgi:hypothetical protein
VAGEAATAPAPVRLAPVRLAPPSTVARPTPRSSGRRTTAYVIGGLGAAGVVAGAGLGASAWYLWRGARAECDDGRCDGEPYDDAVRARRLGTAASITTAAGAAALATAVILYVTDEAPRRVVVGPGTANGAAALWVGGRF